MALGRMQSSGRTRGTKDSFNLVQLTKHMVLAGLRPARALQDPVSRTERIVRETLRVYLTGLKPDFPGIPAGVRDVARGAMAGLLFGNVDPSEGAVSILRAVEEAAGQLALEFESLQAWALEGIADSWRFIPQDGLALVQAGIERAYPGSGPALRRLVGLRSLDLPGPWRNGPSSSLL